ncbi:poly(A)-specific ribonuclease PARN-like isoform X2 [Artemia franciscana]|uniref:poly(A)-specific ribonuclease PARN-like isoform X2 n=1 Tax=Artemia franciscana TaxID=6661 RepID=UPI0032DA5214
MEINVKNFEETFDVVVRDIQQAEFLAIDAEFTGLTDKNLGLLDTVEERYEKLRTSTNYSLVQFGLAVFFREKEGGYSHRAYNFPVFGGFSRKFSVNTDSLILISESGFSLDDMVKNGIPFLNLDEEEKLRLKIEEWKKQQEAELLQKVTNKIGPSAILFEESEYMNAIFSKVERFLLSPDTRLEIENSSRYQRKLMFEHLRYPDLSFESIEGNGSRIFVIEKKPKEEQLKILHEKEKEKLKELEEKVGFSRIVREISKSKKLIMGHNMTLDIIHILHQFISSVPYIYTDFKDMLTETFPRFIDTKVIAAAQPVWDKIQDSSLPTLIETIKRGILPVPNLKDPKPGRGFILTDDKLHNAGFDAFITGVCFMSMMQYLAKIGGTVSLLESTGFVEFPLTEPYLNKLHMMRSIDVKYMNIGGEELQTERSNVFYATFPRHWKSIDLISLFKPLGNVEIQWIDDVSALIAVMDRSKKDSVISMVNKSSSADVISISTYSEYRKSTVKRSNRKRNLITSTPSSKRKVEDSNFDEKAMDTLSGSQVVMKCNLTAENKLPVASISNVFDTPSW